MSFMQGHFSSCRREAIAPFKFKRRQIPLIVVKKQVPHQEEH